MNHIFGLTFVFNLIDTVEFQRVEIKEKTNISEEVQFIDVFSEQLRCFQ